mgnify:CR=1 FL=1
MCVKEYKKKIENGSKVTIIVSSDGIENFKTLPETYYSDYDGVILAFDLSNRNSFDRISDWIDTLENKNKK